MVSLENRREFEIIGGEYIPNPVLHLVNTRVWFNSLQQVYPNLISLTDVPMEEWSKLSKMINEVWFMGIYKPSIEGRRIALLYKDQYQSALPEIIDKDVAASPFAIQAYEPNPTLFNSWENFDNLRRILHGLGIKVILDFVPNHVGRDHPWIYSHPEYFFTFEESEIVDKPFLGQIAFLTSTCIGKRWVAYGKDPNYPPWSDTAQLNYALPEVQEAMQYQLEEIASHCDGVRCDMAMLLNETTFYRTWGWMLNGTQWKGDFWNRAIKEVRKRYPHFIFIAEAYWDQDILFNAGFDRLYAKWFYDQMTSVSRGLFDSIDENKKDMKAEFVHALDFFMTNSSSAGQLTFVENHDEPRAVSHFGEFSIPFSTMLTFFPYAPFMTHEGQFQGRTIKNPMQIQREVYEDEDKRLYSIYEYLLSLRQSPVLRWGTGSVSRGRSPNSPIFGLGRVRGNQGLMACINLSKHEKEDWLVIPEGYVVNGVYDVGEAKDLSKSAFDHGNNGIFYVRLNPMGVQVITLCAK